VPKNTFDKKAYPLQEKTYLLNGIAMEIHRILGRGFLEIVYKMRWSMNYRIGKLFMNVRKSTK